MKTKVEVLEGLLRKLTVEVPSEEVHKKINSQIQKLQKTVKVDGFRPGKVPVQVIQRKYGESIMRDSIDSSVQSSYGEALKAESLEPAGEPAGIKVLSGFAANESLKYEVELEVMPVVEIKGLDAIEIEKPIAQISESDVDEMLETLKKQAGSWKSNSDIEKTEEGHQVVVSFKGMIDGEIFEGGTAKNVQVIIGEGKMLPDFEKAVTGRKSGESFSSDVTFPEDYHSKTLAGKTASFDFEIVAVNVLELPVVDESFIKNFGVEDTTIEGFKKSIRDNLERQLRQVIKTDIQRQVKQQLLDANEFQLPEVMVTNEKQSMSENERLEEKVKDEKVRAEIIENQFDKPARSRVSLGIIMTELFKSFEVKPEQERVNSYIDDIAATYENPDAFREHYKKDAGFMQHALANVLEEQLIDTIAEKANIKEVAKTFKELMKTA